MVATPVEDVPPLTSTWRIIPGPHVSREAMPSARYNSDYQTTDFHRLVAAACTTKLEIAHTAAWRINTPRRAVRTLSTTGSILKTKLKAVRSVTGVKCGAESGGV
jgi:hypothetical protein